MKLFAFASAAVMLCATSPALANDYYYTSNTPATHRDNALVAKNLFDEIRTNTDGRYNVIVSPGAVLVGAKEVAKAVGAGVVETGYVVYAYVPAEMPSHSFLGSIFTANPEVAAPAMTETILLDCPECQQEQDDLNIKILMNGSTLPYIFLCGREPIVTAGDMAGKKIRSVGTQVPLVDALGGTGVNITVSEIYEAMQRGQVDCTLWTETELQGSQMWEIAHHVTTSSVGTFNGLGWLTVNADLWKDMSAEDKRAWLDASANGLAEQVTMRYDWAVEVREAIKTEGHDVTFHEPDASLTDAIAKFRSEELSGQIETAKSRGVDSAEEITKAFQANVEKWDAITKEIGPQPWDAAQKDIYRQKIKSEIYDKVAVE